MLSNLYVVLILKGDLNLIVEDKVYRAIPGGTGGVKAVTNYSPVRTRFLKVVMGGYL